MDTLIQGGNVIPLPVLWSKLTSRTEGTDILLEWQTFMEQNNAGFYVERSVDATHWNVIAILPSKAEHGFSNSLIPYNFKIEEKFAGIYYYRVVQKSNSGKVVTSNVVTVPVNGQTTDIIVYPNPVKNELYLLGIPDQAEFSIYDFSGKQVLKGKYHDKIKISSLRNGIYWIRCAGRNLKVVIDSNRE